MNILFLVIPLTIYLEVNGNEEESNEENSNTTQLHGVGCDDKGYLLDANICINSTYNFLEPPKTLTAVYRSFLTWPKILDIDEELGTVKIYLQDWLLLWEDARIKINLDDIDSKKLKNVSQHIPTTQNDLRFLLLPFQLWNEKNDDYGVKLWIPFRERLEIENVLSLKGKMGYSPWGIQDYGVVFTSTLNELISMRMNFYVTMECKFDYSGFPWDSQRCNLSYVCDRNKPLNLSSYDPMEMCNQLDEGYELKGFYVSTSCAKTKSGMYFHLRRNAGKYFFQYYLPSAMIVFVSQISFVIPLSAIPGRIGLVVTQFLALTNIFINEQSESLTKTKFNAIGSYILISLTFVIATLFQLAALLILKQKSEDKIGSSEKNAEIADRNTIKIQKLIKRIDKLCLLLFPSSFILFNGIYMAIMM